MLHAHSMAILHPVATIWLKPRSGAKRTPSTKLTHSATLWRAVLTTLYTLIEFASPVVLPLHGQRHSARSRTSTSQNNWQCDRRENAKTDPSSMQMLFSPSRIHILYGALLSCHHFHTSASSLKCLDAVLTVVELDSERRQARLGGSFSSASTSNRSATPPTRRKISMFCYWICLDCSHATFPSPWPSSCLRWQ